MCEQQSRHASVQHKTAHHLFPSPSLSPSLCSRFVADALKSVGCQAQARSRLQAQYAMRIMCVKAKISPIANGEGHKHTNTRTHAYGCKQMHPHKQLNSWPNCWCALITHTPHVPSSSLVCHNCQLATSICARSRFKYAFALSTQLVSFLISVVNKYTTQFGAHRH